MVYKIIYKSERGEVWLMLLIVLQKLLNKEKGYAECIEEDGSGDLNKDDREHVGIRFWV